MRPIIPLGLLGLTLGYPMAKRKQAGKGHMGEAGLGGFTGYDTGMARSEMGFQRRQGGGGGRGGGGGGEFETPSFNIPFQANFAFNEFSSPFGGSSNFPQFLSALGGQRELSSASPFIQELEQGFERPQESSQFKRQTGDYSPPSLSRHSSARSQPLERRPEPVYTPPARVIESRKQVVVDREQPVTPAREEHRVELRRVQPVYRAHTQDFPQVREESEHMFQTPDFPTMDFNTDFEPAKFQAQEKHMMENMRLREQEQSNIVMGRESAQGEGDRSVQHQQDRIAQEQENKRAQELKIRKAQEQENRRAHEQEKMMLEEQEREKIKYQQQLEQSRRQQAQKIEKFHEKKMEFQPPSLIEKFKQPVVKSEPFPFQLPSFPSPPPPATPAAPSPLPSYNSFKPVPEQQKSTVTKKPVFQYKKQNFREPVKSLERDQGPHPLIRIKPKRQSASPRPGQAKQLSHGGGFQPYRPPVEVRRQGQPVREPVFDNDQEIITAPRIRKEPNTGSFSVDVKASFAPRARPEVPGRRAEVSRRRSIQLPRAGQDWRGGKRGRSLGMDEGDILPFLDRRGGERQGGEVEVMPFFDSVRV